MILIYNVDVPMARLPVANWCLIGLTCLVSLAILVIPPPALQDLSQEDLEELFKQRYPGEEPPNSREILLAMVDEAPADELPPPLSLRRDDFSVGQLFTYVLVHADLGHLLGNMVFLFVFGNAVNAKIGHVPFLVCYFALWALAGIPWLLFGPGEVLVGASGAIMGITGMFLVFFPRNDVLIFYFFFFHTGVVRVMSCWVVLAAMALDFLGTLYGAGTIAYISHLGGELIGIVLAGSLAAWGFFPSEIYEENLLQVLGFQEPSGRFDALGKPVVRNQGRAAPKSSGQRRAARTKRTEWE